MMIKPLRTGLLLLMLLPLTVRGFDGSLQVQSSDNPLQIQGWVGDENSFIGNIGVTLTGATPGSPAVKLNIYRSDLKTADGTQLIGRHLVTVTGDQTLAPNVTSTYQVKVTGVTAPGSYGGTIELALDGQPRENAVKINVTVIANVRPTLSLLAENPTLQTNLVACKYDCRLAELLLPTARRTEIALSFEKPLSAPLVISDVTAVVKGDESKLNIPPRQLTVSLDQLTPPPTLKKYLTLPVTINTEDLPADHYTGSIYLTVAGQTNPLKVPVDFNIRLGPLWPLLILLISILLGRLYKFMQDKGNALAAALESINRLEFRLRNAHAEDVAIITPMLSPARDLVTEKKATEASAAVAAISARISTLRELRQIEARLTGKENPAIPPILADIRLAREHIRFGQDESAKTLVTKIKDALVALVRTPGAIDTDSSDLKDAAERADAAAAAAAPLGAETKTISSRLRSGLVMLSGLSDRFRTEATLFLGRPIIGLALLLGLLALGLKTQYLDNPDFGANPFTDFLGLVFWGLSTDVASRTLSGLRLDRPSGG